MTSTNTLTTSPTTNDLFQFYKLLQPTQLDLPPYVMMFIPKKLRGDVDKSLSCLTFCFLAFSLIFNAFLVSMIDLYYTQMFSKYFLLMLSSVILIGSLVALLYITSAIDILIHPLLLLIFAANFTRTITCGSYAIMVASPIRVITLFATFLQCSKKSVCFYFCLCMVSWVCFFIVTPFPFQHQTCGMSHRALNYIVGTLVLLTSTIMAFTFSKIRSIKNELLLLQRDRASLAAQLYIDFTKSLSHEIRTPLFTVIGLVDLLMDDPRISHQEHKDALQNILLASDELNKLLTSNLDSSNPSKAYGMRPRSINNLEKDVKL